MNALAGVGRVILALDASDLALEWMMKDVATLEILALFGDGEFQVLEKAVLRIADVQARDEDVGRRGFRLADPR